jgi:DtxR family transcriptional regulator, Mn-dependent transcriptional regulator
MSDSASPRLGRSTEDYIKAIFKLEERDPFVSTSNLAKAVGVSPAAATKAVRQLSRRDLATHEPYRGVALTAGGKKVALEIIRHHRLLETFLHDILGYSWDEVDEEAERLEHHISEKFEAAIDKLLGYPSFDPHGDPIPDIDGGVAPRRGRSLADAEAADRVVIVRVRDRSPEALKYLSQLGLHVGVAMDVIEKQPFNGPLMLRVASEDRVVSRELADHVFVERRQADQEVNNASGVLASE